MLKFRVRGVYEMRYFIEVDEEIEADSTEEALEEAANRASIADAYDQENHWSVCDQPKAIVVD